MAENIKLQHLDISYKVDKKKKTIVCFGTFGLQAFPENVMEVVGVARCRKEDKFNETVGKQVARAKCEKTAFSNYAKVLEKQIKESERFLENLKFSHQKMVANIKHQKDYLKTF